MRYGIMSSVARTLSCPSYIARYGTWVLSRFAQLNTGRLQPVLEVERVLSQESIYVESIGSRKLDVTFDPSRISALFERAKQLKGQMRAAEVLRKDNALQVQEMIHLLKEDSFNTDNIKGLRETGKSLRDGLRRTTLEFNVANDELVDLILLLPNILHPRTPRTEGEVIREVEPSAGVTLWQTPKNLRWERITGVSVYPEFLSGNGLLVELDLAAKSQKYLLQHGFVETGNVDFVKRVLLDGAGLDPSQFLRVRQPKNLNGVEHATYLVGGSSFPAFLALFAQSLLHNDDVLPIRYFVIGRKYEKKGGTLPFQHSTVQAFVACRDEAEEELEFERMTTLMEEFYAEKIGLSFKTHLLPAPQLKPYEKKKVVFVSSEDKVIGGFGSVGDYVSKRLISCYIDPNRSPKFLHFLTGSFLHITNLLRPSLKEPPL